MHTHTNTQLLNLCCTWHSHCHHTNIIFFLLSTIQETFPSFIFIILCSSNLFVYVWPLHHANPLLSWLVQKCSYLCCPILSLNPCNNSSSHEFHCLTVSNLWCLLIHLPCLYIHWAFTRLSQPCITP